jgi:alpha,alpha-trehalase
VGIRSASAALSIAAGTIAALALAAPPQTTAAPPPDRAPAAADLDALHAYIRASWSTLTRTHRDLPQAAVDPKFPDHRGPWPVYLSPRESLPAIRKQLEAELAPEQLGRIELRHLHRGHLTGGAVEPGLIFLPRPYVVPGGRFNEMYGWDSYFIVRGLLRQNEIALAQDMVRNAVYEVMHFGKVLNANRTYYLQRSQPPFLTAMIRAVYEVTHDRAWLAWTLPAVRRQYRYWTTAPHLAGTTGLSRYRALGVGPAPEVEAGERDAAGQTHYQRVRAALRAALEHAGAGGAAGVAAANRAGEGLDIARFYDRRHDRLTPLFYEADRSMRESGFDPSDRFGRFGLGVLDYAPVCLNSLLYVMERDMAYFLEQLGGAEEAPRWGRLAEQRGGRMRALLWDPVHGLFADHDFVRGGTRHYPFATTFFPLWAGVASPEQARQTAREALRLLAAPGGLSTSSTLSGSQWDAPFAWAPLQLVAVEGLRRYGLTAEADQVALSFLGTVLDQFVEHGTVFEKYDATRRRADVAPGLRFGYASNEIGFGWTNAAFVELEAGLGASADQRILRAAAR